MKLFSEILFALVHTCIIFTSANGQDIDFNLSEPYNTENLTDLIGNTQSPGFNDDLSVSITDTELLNSPKINIRGVPPYLLNDNYIVTLVKLNWHAAYAFCEQNHWSLLRIETPLQQFEVQTYLNFFNLQSNDFWTAGNNFADLRNFRWEYDGPSFRYTNWAFGQPDNHKGGEHCVKIYKNSLQWGDDSCENSYHFICQRYDNRSTTSQTPF